MAIKGVPVRATINIGKNSLIIKTPFIISFTVNKQRGAPSTFNASVKVSHDDIKGSFTAGPIYIEAGTFGNEKRIFTGMILSSAINPCFDDPNFVNLSLSGADVLKLLEGKKYTRRCRAIKSSFATIQSVVRKGLKSKKFTNTNEGTTFDFSDGTMDSHSPVTRSKSQADQAAIPVGEAKSDDAPGAADLSIEIVTEEAGGA